MFHEVALPHAPVYQQVLGEKGRDDHAASVVHPSHLVQLAHGRIDDGKTCAALGPGCELGLVIRPRDVGVLWFEVQEQTKKNQKQKQKKKKRARSDSWQARDPSTNVKRRQ